MLQDNSIEAWDMDVSLNAQLTYRVTGSGAEMFNIDPLTAQVTVSVLGGSLLDRENTKLYKLQVRSISDVQ